METKGRKFGGKQCGDGLRLNKRPVTVTGIERAKTSREISTLCSRKRREMEDESDGWEKLTTA